MAVQRLGAWRLDRVGPSRPIATVAYKVLNVFVRNVYGTEIYDTTVLGRRVVIGHLGGTVIDSRAVIGDDCLIRQNVTIGQTRPEGPSPTLGRGVDIGAGAVILGGVSVGDGARIGPNAVVIVDVPAGATAFAPPARLMRGSPKASASELDGEPPAQD